MPDELLEIEATIRRRRPRPWTPLLRRQARGPTLTERRARQDLRRQIAPLERRLGELFASAFPRQGIDWSVGAVGGPRVLGIAELERVATRSPRGCATLRPSWAGAAKSRRPTAACSSR